MTTLYSHDGQYPAPLPFRIRLPSGQTRTDPATFSLAEIADAGFVEAPAQPSFDQERERLGWDGGAWVVETLPPPPAPVAVSMRQARLALHGAGLLEQVDGAIAALEEPHRTQAQIEWEYAAEMRRDHPLIALLGAELELDEPAIDALFVAAAQIE